MAATRALFLSSPASSPSRSPPPPPPPSPPRPPNTRLLHQLLRERAFIHRQRIALPNLCALLDTEIARLRNTTPSSSPSSNSSSSTPRKRVKLPVPSDKFPDYNFVGRLLGPRGTTLKTLERDTACRIMIRGKGSIRKDKEPDVRGKPGWEHVFNEPLHVVIEAPDSLHADPNAAATALARAAEAVHLLLVPVPEERDTLKRQQLRTLAMMNGTYVGASPSSSTPAASQQQQQSQSSPTTRASTSNTITTTTNNTSSITPSSTIIPPYSLPFSTQPQHQIPPHLTPSILSAYDPLSLLKDSAAMSLSAHPSRTAATSNSSILHSLKQQQQRHQNHQPNLLPSPLRSLSSSFARKLSARSVNNAIDEFATSSVGDDTPESSQGSEHDDFVTPPKNMTPSAQPKLSNAAASLGVGGFIGQEFYNGAFSNGASSPLTWDQTTSNSRNKTNSLNSIGNSNSFSSFGVLPSPHVLTTSSSTVTPLNRHHDGY